jgi:hypothetical protein
VAGTVSVSAGVQWSVSSGLFYWVLNDIARHTRDVGLAGHLNEIDRENLGWFGFEDITPGQRREVRRIITERLVSDGEREFTANMLARPSALALLADLVAMVSAEAGPRALPGHMTPSEEFEHAFRHGDGQYGHLGFDGTLKRTLTRATSWAGSDCGSLTC